MSQLDLQFLSCLGKASAGREARSLSVHRETTAASCVSGTFVCNVAASVLSNARELSGELH